MPLATAVVSYDISDLVGTDFDARRTKVWVTTNIPGNVVVDTLGNAIRVGDGLGTIAEDGTGSVSVWVPGTGSNPASWQTYVHLDFAQRRPGAVREQLTFGPFTVTESANLADLIAEQEIPPTYLSSVTTALQGYVDAAEAAAAEAANVSGLTGEDDAVAALVADDTSDTRTALDVLFGGGSTVVDASETVKGIVELATTAETVAGTDAVRAATPAGVKAAVAGANGAIYDVRAYGALLNNVADDSAAIQAAIDACSTAGGGVVYIPAQASTGTSGAVVARINTTLRVRAGVWLRGAGPASVLTGAANPMIALPTSGARVDRITISDLFLQSPAGVGVHLSSAGQTGGYQLGWPRITVENVTVADAVSHAFEQALSGVIETRYLNCVSLRAQGHGFLIGETDNFLVGCTAAAGTNANFAGFALNGANNKASACKAYGNVGNGFQLAGSGRHVLSGCESQDNVKYGYYLDSGANTIAGCLSDSDKLAGFSVNTNDNTIAGCTTISGGGGSGQVAPVGVLLLARPGVSLDPQRNLITGHASTLVTKVGGNVFNGGNVIEGRGVSRVAYAAAIAPDPHRGDGLEVTLTGNTTVNAPASARRGQRLTLAFRQDAVGGRTVTFGPAYAVAWTPVTTAYTINIITFVNDGGLWIQESATVGLAPSVVADDFNRADNASLGSTPLGSKAWTQHTGSIGIVSNQAAPGGSCLATVDTGRSSCRVNLTLSNRASPCGILFRYIDNSNYLYFLGDEIAGKVAGANVGVVSGLGGVASGDTLSLDLAGGSIAAYVNGTLRWAGVHNPLLSATRHGIIGNSASDRFDNFEVV